MLIKRLIAALFILACIVTYICSAIDLHTGQRFSIDVDLSKPLAVLWPMEVTIVGDMGEKGLRIAPKVGRGWLGEAGGRASYRFYAPEDGRYYIWARCLWFDECSNAVFARIDNMDKAVIGNDNIYNQWHWVRGFAVELRRGAHDLELSNHSDHISLQSVLLINSSTVLPDDGGLIFSDIFYDGFDGCDIGNFASWEPVRGEWFVKTPEQQSCFFENALIGTSQDGACIVYESDDWTDYSLNVAVKSLPSSDASAATGVCFGVEDPNHYHCLKWRPAGDTDKCEMEISRKASGETQLLAAFEVAWQSEQWNKVEVSLNRGDIAVKVNEEEPVRATVEYTITGGIGLLLEGEITAYFDDIHVRSVSDSEDP